VGGLVNLIQQEIDRIVDDGIPGAFAYIEDLDGTLQFYTAGWADLYTKQRMTPDSHYRVGSTTKTFTAVVLLQLVLERKLSLEDTVEKLLPDLNVPNSESMTIEHLLRMRSGLFDFEDDPELAGNLEAHLHPQSLSKVISLAMKHPALFPPGRRFSYCNTNYCLLEIIIQRTTGKSLGEEFTSRVFAPLRMTNTVYPEESDLTLPEPYIRGYDRTTEGWRECSQVFFGRGDGALISTPRDLARFFRGLLIEKSLLPENILSQMMRVIDDNPPADEEYGLGLMADQLACGTVWGHAGGGYGYGNLPYANLKTGKFAVFMRNASAGFHTEPDPGVKEIPRFSREVRSMAYLKESA
jgi:D-alanyl-D-alanine carboxypeptidase